MASRDPVLAADEGEEGGRVPRTVTLVLPTQDRARVVARTLRELGWLARAAPPTSDRSSHAVHVRGIEDAEYPDVVVTLQRHAHDATLLEPELEVPG